MQVTYELTQKDFTEACFAHRNRRAVARWGIRFLIAIPCLMVVLTAIQFVTGTASASAASEFTVAIGLMAFYVLLFWGAPLWSAQLQFRNQPAAKGERSLTVDSAGCHLSWDTGASEIKWAHFVRWMESKNVLLLYCSPILFNIIPKRAFTPEQLSEFRAILTQNVVQK